MSELDFLAAYPRYAATSRLDELRATEVDDLQTALLVVVPEAEEAVGRHRAGLDRAAQWNVPAHITVLFPFLPPAQIDADVRAAVAQTVRAVPRFRLTLARTAWFGEKVLWLAPDPAGPLRDLTAALTARFPRCPPYGGAFTDVVPHLTVADDHPRADLDAAAAAVTAHLPIRAAVTDITLITGRREPGTWRTVARFPLG
jgi:2'-5' RNA ligase